MNKETKETTIYTVVYGDSDELGFCPRIACGAYDLETLYNKFSKYVINMAEDNVCYCKSDSGSDCEVCYRIDFIKNIKKYFSYNFKSTEIINKDNIRNFKYQWNHYFIKTIKLIWINFGANASVFN